jgi:hypothetical protein
MTCKIILCFSDVLTVHGAPGVMSFSEEYEMLYSKPWCVVAQTNTISKNLQKLCCFNHRRFTFNNPLYTGHAMLLILNVLSAVLFHLSFAFNCLSLQDVKWFCSYDIYFVSINTSDKHVAPTEADITSEASESLTAWIKNYCNLKLNDNFKHDKSFKVN